MHVDSREVLGWLSQLSFKVSVEGMLGGKKMVRVEYLLPEGLVFKGVQEKYAQSIMGATLKRRDGSGRVVCGFEAFSRSILGYVVMYHFLVACWV